MFLVYYRENVYAAPLRVGYDSPYLDDALVLAAQKIGNREARSVVCDDSGREIAIVWGKPSEPKKVRSLHDEIHQDVVTATQKHGKIFQSVESKTLHLSRGLVAALGKIHKGA